MPITFGSVGDIISISLIVKDPVKALDDSRGSASEYREVVRDLLELDSLLLQVELASRTHEQTAELNALCVTAKSIVQSCRECVEQFKERIKKYESSLGAGTSRSVITGAAMKIRWQVCHKDDLEKFRQAVHAHYASLNVLISMATLNVMNSNDKKLEARQQAAVERSQEIADTQKSLLLIICDRLAENTQILKSTADRFDQGLKLLWLRKLGTEVTGFVKKIFIVNIAIYRIVSEIRASLPSHLERSLYQEPFHLEDAIGRVFPVHLQFISTWDAFDAVLETRFRNLQGHKKILDKDFVLQERATKRDISRDLQWEGAFLPGQKIDMSIIFTESRDDRQKCCPGCLRECNESSEAGTQCPHCGILFGRIIEIVDLDPTEPIQPQPQPETTVIQAEDRQSASTPQGSKISCEAIPNRPTPVMVANSFPKSTSNWWSGQKRAAKADHPHDDQISRFKRVRIIFKQNRVRKSITKSTFEPKLSKSNFEPILPKEVRNWPLNYLDTAGFPDIPPFDPARRERNQSGDANATSIIPLSTILESRRYGATESTTLWGFRPDAAECLDATDHIENLSGRDFEADDVKSVASPSGSRSLTSSITAYEVENGRTYHAYHAGIYFLPNDNLEQERLEMQHYVIFVLLDEQYILAPIDSHKRPRKILDHGTGTGIWAMEIGDIYGDAEVVGIDLCPIQPKWVPPNVKFEIDDVDDEVCPWLEYDMIHCGLGNGFSKRRWSRYLEHAYASLNPGGWFEIKDFDITPACQDGTLPQDSAIVRWHGKLVEGAKLGDVNIRFSSTEVKSQAEKAGFINVTVKEFAVPIGSWCRDPKMKKLGMYQQLVFQTGLEAYSLAIFTRLLKWSVEDVKSLLAEVQTELKNRSYHWYWPFFVIYGQKAE